MGKSEYIVEFGGLSVGLHDFEFEVTDKFFKSIENSEIERATIRIKATLTKQNNLLNMHFEIAGTVGATCDRCIKNFDLPVETEEDLVIKFGDPADSNDEILIIPEGETRFEISQYLYEYIVLAMPARRVACELDPEFDCDRETLDKLNQLNADAADDKEPSNPMWEQLNKIKKFNQN